MLLLVTFLAAASFAIAKDPAPVCTFVADPNPTWVGGSTAMKCACDPPASQTWIYALDNAGVWDGTRDFALDKDFRIAPVKASDVGKYQCWAKFSYPDKDFEGGNSVYTDLELDLLDPPTETKVQIDPNPVNEDQEFTIKCTQLDGDQPTSFTIFKKGSDGIEVPFQTVPAVPDSLMVEYTVPMADEDTHECTYLCRSTNPAGTSDNENQVYLGVIEPPTETKVELNPNPVNQDEEFTIKCTQLDGDQPTSFTIFKKGSDGSEVLFQTVPAIPDSMIVEYTVAMAKEDTHEGTYLCRSTNPAGTSDNKNEVFLEVIELPTETKVEIDPNPVNEDEEFTIKCTQLDGDQPTSFTIFKKGSDGSEVPFQTVPAVPDSMEAQYTVATADEDEHEGTYLCRSTNPAGTSDNENEVLLEVIEPPTKTEIEIDPYSVIEVKEFIIKCTQLDGDQPSSFTFFKKGSDGSEVPFQTVPAVPDSMMAEYTVTNADEEEHEGTYFCRSTNPAGTSEPNNEEDLEVLNEPDSVKLVISPNPVKECQNVMMTAEVVNDDPTKSYVFKKTDGSNTIPSNTNQITIENVSPEDAGEWVVEATGMDDDTTTSPVENLVVKDPQLEFTTDNCDNRKYLFKSCKKTRAEALECCTDKGMKLAAYLDKTELRQVYDNIKAMWPEAAGEPFWTGYSRSGPAAPWNDGACSSAPVYPDLSSYASGNCVISQRSSIFDVRDCLEKHAFVCMEADCDVAIPDITYQDDKYVVFNRRVDRDRAQYICQSLNMQLFSINSMTEMMAVCIPLLSKQLSTTPYWTGPKEVGTKYIDYCGTEIPAPIMDVFVDGPNITDPKCTVLKNDLYYAVPCPDTCVGFICEQNADNC